MYLREGVQVKWSMDTHKYMSEITRTALQVIAKHGITSESKPEEIDAVEKELVEKKVYKDYPSAKGRVRRALFTYFRAYGCLNDVEQLTEVGREFIANRLSVKELSFEYILNYKYADDNAEYYPAQLILTCLRKLYDRDKTEAYITPYDFSRIVECDALANINDEFITECISSHTEEHDVNERNIGYDVWSKMLVQAGILSKDSNHNLCIVDYNMVAWILQSYTKGYTTEKGNICTGIIRNVPVVTLDRPTGNYCAFENEGRAVQAYLFDAVDEGIIRKYIYTSTENSYNSMRKALGLTDTNKGFYKMFSGLEHLVGYALISNQNPAISGIGKIIAAVELSDDEREVLAEDLLSQINEKDRISGGSNILLYGVPGSGKSWTIEHEYVRKGVHEQRLVFHPDYTYSDFVGQILPNVAEDGQVSYEFTAGPFTNIMRDAYWHPSEEYVLVIEEINRGNAPAIFGEIFQLLDRKQDNLDEKDDSTPVGTSEYGITNTSVANIIYGNSERKVRIPSNLSIIGTMNTSDQNVFTLDTAFQRRWEMRLIENTFENVDPAFADQPILDTGITWRVFCTQMNHIIIENGVRTVSSEDKRLGAYFVHLRDLVYNDKAKDNYDNEFEHLCFEEKTHDISDIDRQRLQEMRAAKRQNRRFPEKVLKYLWDDAFKFNRETVFDVTNYSSLEAVIRKFVDSEARDRMAVFNQTIVNTFTGTQ